MGKYIRKSKLTGDVAVMEFAQPSSLGVRTRAKTLALQRAAASPPSKPDSCYLELRSRRLEKPPPPPQYQLQNSRKEGEPGIGNESGQKTGSVARTEELDIQARNYEHRVFGIEIEASFGENNLDLEDRRRSTRESTPCSLIPAAGTIATPGSTSRRATPSSSTQQTQNALLRNLPTASEIEEFFARAEEWQQRLFMEKYNFDIVNDSPLPGRYEWVKVIP